MEPNGHSFSPMLVHDDYDTEFLGCVNFPDQCHHVSEHAGFHHYTLQHDHDTCPDHPHLACYGYND